MVRSVVPSKKTTYCSHSLSKKSLKVVGLRHYRLSDIVINFGNGYNPPIRKAFLALTLVKVVIFKRGFEDTKQQTETSGQTVDVSSIQVQLSDPAPGL